MRTALQRQFGPTGLLWKASFEHGQALVKRIRLYRQAITTGGKLRPLSTWLAAMLLGQSLPNGWNQSKRFTNIDSRRAYPDALLGAIYNTVLIC